MAQTRLTLFASLLTLASLAGCNQNRTVNAAAAPASPAPAPQPMAPMMGGAPMGEAPTAGPTATGRVVETMNASNYTYVRVKAATGDIWAAAGQFKVAVGDQVVVPLNMPMQNFHSATLNRTFPMIYFASHIDKVGGAEPKK